MSKAFITGSRAYGTPTAESDVDLVLRMDHEEAQLLIQCLDLQPGKPMRIGKLNLIICVTDEQYAVWREGTTQLMHQGITGDKPSRGQAIHVLDELLKEKGLKYKALWASRPDCASLIKLENG